MTQNIRTLRLAQSLVAVGVVTLIARAGAPAPTVDRDSDLTDDQRREIQERLDLNAATLTQLGLLQPPPPSLLATHPILDWPLRTPTLHDPGYHTMWAFVDQNPTFPNAVLDYNCGNRTYDTTDGYNHRGSDFLLYPYPWKRLDEGTVQVVAAAAGTILGKDDGYFDRSCVRDFSNPWNAVYLQHADGSRTWYAHLQNGSLTSKAVGATVASGEYLGLVGSSGATNAPHLHFEMYDSSGALNDPYQGACNGMNATSWWASQRPYYDSAVNRVATGFAFPATPACPAPEEPHEAADFNPGDKAYFLAYFRDLQAGQVGTFTIRKPDGSVFQTWSGTPNPTFQFSWFDGKSFMSFPPPPGGPLGVWRFDVTLLGQTTSRYFRLTAPTGSGRVPGEFVDEVPLLIDKSGSSLSLTWDASCVPTDTDYEVYEGTIGSWTSHAPALCSTGGNTNATIAPSAGDKYYLIVPFDPIANREGSYGWNGAFVERPVGAPSCRAQAVGGSCPRCGDLRFESPEVCDGNQLNGHTCQTEGFTDGLLGCALDCRSFDTSGCF